MSASRRHRPQSPSAKARRRRESQARQEARLRELIREQAESLERIMGPFDEMAFQAAVWLHKAKHWGSWKCPETPTWEAFVARRLNIWPSFAEALVENGRGVERAVATQPPFPGAPPDIVKGQLELADVLANGGGMFAPAGPDAERWGAARTLESAEQWRPGMKQLEEVAPQINRMAFVLLNASGIVVPPGGSVEEAGRKRFAEVFGSAAGGIARVALLAESLNADLSEA